MGTHGMNHQKKYSFFSKNNVLFLFVICTLIILLSTSCSRKVDGNSVLTLSIPAGFGSSKITNFKYSEPVSLQSVSTMSEETDDGSDWNPALNPSNISQVNCYVVFVTGAEPELRRNVCSTTTGQNLFVGRWVGGIPAGGILSLEVPSGPQREITVVGFKGLAGACTNFKTMDVKGMDLSEPHVLGSVVKDLSPGTVSVTIPVTVTTSTLKLKDCTGPDFSLDRVPLYFGDQTTGSTVISSNKTYSTMTGAYSSRVNTFNPAPTAPNDKFTFIGTSVSTTGLTVGSEIMLAIQGTQGGWTGSGNNTAGPCGYRAWEGRYTFARVLGVSTTPQGFYINKGTFFDNLDFNPVTNAIDPTQKAAVIANMTATADPSNNFCRIRAIKVLHFYDLSVDPGITLSADPFGYETENAGILPIRVAHLLTLANGATIDASGKGYTASAGYAGAGIHGDSTTACTAAPTDTGTGGSCSPSDIGAGGGGHGNVNGTPFAGSGGTGGNGSAVGGSGAGDDCGDGSCFGNLSHKIFLGGAGGSSVNSTASTGGAGGGIVYLMARNLKVVAGASANINSAGQTATTNSSYANYGAGGGGAGGSIFLGYQNLDLTSATLVTDVSGGPGGLATATATNASGGGGGGGGRMQVLSCLSSVSSIGALTKILTGGAAGTSTTGGVDGDPGLSGSIVQEAIPCY